MNCWVTLYTYEDVGHCPVWHLAQLHTTTVYELAEQRISELEDNLISLLE